ncbi:hypothetical protein [Actinomadura parmotrematis]|uniref:Uncharacterized protein n=1 Tax=Actinomadura parmotrematis TaxID=2864039 RepID=A0ABS7G2H7_9ACTN|nr:hypothetical protein [Actinomadura parmotrematis]MBW8486420.1 hypothetical protein [Actinomadura parmotrematis]
MPARTDGGALRGGAPRAVWLTSETDPQAVSARSVAADLVRAGRPAHLVWNPATGETVQLLPATRAGLALDGPAGTEGRVQVQIVVVGYARAPFTAVPFAGLEPITRWLDSWDVARRWPAGPPLPSPQSYHAARDRRSWARGGHFGASQVPGTGRPDPGAVDARRITGPDTPVAPIPLPRPLPGREAPGRDTPGREAAGLRLARPVTAVHAAVGQPGGPPVGPPLPGPVPEPASSRS